MTTSFPQKDEQNQLVDLLQNKEMIVCYGAGGVGKTTTSAALGIKAALMGRRVLALITLVTQVGALQMATRPRAPRRHRRRCQPC